MPLSTSSWAGQAPNPSSAPAASANTMHLVKGGVKVGVITGLRAGASVPDGATAVDPAMYSETPFGSALLWPRAYRDGLLATTDWTQVSDVALTADQIADAKAYRAALRNLPTTSPTAAAVAWPTPPTWLSPTP